ncbi:MAG: zinc-binding dehydrogenase [Gammaproteobacteria bacterium]
MKAVVMRNQQLTCEERPIPQPLAGQVLVRTRACGICGSDLHLMKHGHRLNKLAEKSGLHTGMRFNTDMNQDLIMGHEFSAEILEYGSGSSKPLPIGNLVTSMPLLLQGERIMPLGLSNELIGGYAEYMLLQEALMISVPEGIPASVAAFTEPLAVGLHAVEAADYTGAPLALVAGCGPVGLAVICCLKAKGIDVIATDLSEDRRQLAKLAGADQVWDARDASIYSHFNQQLLPEDYEPGSLGAIMGLQGVPRPGIIFECVGKSGILSDLIAYAPQDAQIISVGACMEAETFEPLFATYKQLRLRFVLGYTPEEFSQCLDWISSGAVSVEPLITRKVGIEQLAPAFESLLTNPKDGKVMMISEN